MVFHFFLSLGYIVSLGDMPRSRSPSTLSEGEIVESGSEMKATMSQAPFNGINVDRQTRRSPPLPPPPPRRRSRTRSRSPHHYQERRQQKRRRDDDYDSRQRRHRYGDRSSFYDYDREQDYGYAPGAMRYSDDSEWRDERGRRRSSPYHHHEEVRKPNHYSSEELDTRKNVSWQGDSPAEQNSMLDAEIRKNQVSQGASIAADHDGYVFFSPFFFFEGKLTNTW